MIFRSKRLSLPILGLFSLQVQALDCELRQRSDSSAIYQCDALKIVKLRGNSIERAKELGRLHRQGHLSNKLLDEFATKAQRTVSSNKILQELIGVYLDAWIYQRSRSSQLKLQMKELKAFSEAANYSKTKLLRALYTPDLATFAEGSESFGCTSAVLSTAGNYFGVARNLDFAGVGIFDEHPAILVNLSTDPRELSYFGIAAEGVPWAGITGMNEAGLFFAVHQNFSKDVNGKKGYPLLFLGDKMLRSSRNLEEAIAFLKKNRPLEMWTLLLVDFNAKKSAAVELSNNRINVRYMKDGKLGQSNHLVATPEASQLETSKYARLWNSRYRLSLVENMLADLQENAASMSDEKRSMGMRDILAHQHSADGTYSAYRDIQRADTIQSVLVDEDSTGAQKVYLGISSAPTSTGSYISLQLADLFSDIDADKLSFAHVESVTETSKRARQKLYTAVYVASEDQKDYAKAISLLKGESTPEALLMRSWLLYKDRRFTEALQTLDVGFPGELSPTGERRLEESAWVLKAKVLYDMGQRLEARDYARERLSFREQFENPDRQNYLKIMTTERYVRHGKWERRYYPAPSKLVWNIAYGDFRQ